MDWRYSMVYCMLGGQLFVPGLRRNSKLSVESFDAMLIDNFVSNT